jgi:nucleotide-binding universal stress UspA family protein
MVNYSRKMGQYRTMQPTERLLTYAPSYQAIASALCVDWENCQITLVTADNSVDRTGTHSRPGEEAQIGPKVELAPSPDVTDGPVICATSFHRGNTLSIALAAGIAAFCCAFLECVHVLPDGMAEEPQGCHVVPEVMRSALIADAKRSGVTLGAEQCHTLFGKSISTAITAYAAERAAQFIVLGIRQGGRFAAHLPTGIAASIVSSAPCPVLLCAGQE